jgi:hypothetical protein
MNQAALADLPDQTKQEQTEDDSSGMRRGDHVGPPGGIVPGMVAGKEFVAKKS